MLAEPSPRFLHSSAAVGDQLYLWGGHTEDFLKKKNVLASALHSFHPALESWERHKCSGPPPPALHGAACVSTGNYLYLYGGYDGSNCRGSLYRLDTKSQKWQQLK